MTPPPAVMPFRNDPAGPGEGAAAPRGPALDTAGRAG